MPSSPPPSSPVPASPGQPAAVSQPAVSQPAVSQPAASQPAAPGEWSAATRAVVAGRPPRRADGPVNPDVVLTSTYHAVVPATGTERVYGRFSNPTWEALEDALASLEGGRALVLSSGMAAVAAVLEQVPVGGTVVVPDAAYNTTLGLADDLAGSGRLQVRRVDLTDLAAVGEAVAGADLLWLESPTNPLLQVADVQGCCAAARAAGALAVVDNTFATPLLQRPLELGADVVVHSVTKLLAGHSDVVLGAVVTADEALLQRLHHHRTTRGAVPGPWEAWLALRGLRTLPLRLERSQANARELAERARRHPAVRRVRYPGLGTVVSIELDDAAAADAVMTAVRLWLPATSLGGVESLLERRRRHANEPATVPPSLLRLSVGVEDVEDLWSDLAAALDAAPADRPPAG